MIFCDRCRINDFVASALDFYATVLQDLKYNTMTIGAEMVRAELVRCQVV